MNVNRETLQESKIIKIIQKKLVRKTLDMIKAFAKEKDVVEDEEEEEAEIGPDGTVTESKKEKKDKETPWQEWYKKFSTSLKLGVLEDTTNRKRLMSLLRFESYKSNGKMISFNDYINDMKDWQEEIYMLAGTDVEAIKKSPFMDPFIEKDVDVLFLTDPIDEYVFAQVKDHEDKKFTDISREDVKFKDEDPDLQKRRDKAYVKKLKPLTKWLRKFYGNSIMRITISNRLGTSPAIVTSSRYGNSANMERIMRAQTLTHDSGPQGFSMKIFEINPRHPLILKLLEGAPPEDSEDNFEPSEEIKDAAWLLHDMAMMNGGFPIPDPLAHNKRMTKFLQSQLGVESLNLEPAIDPPEEEEEAPDFDADAMGGMGGINLDDFDMNDLDLDA